MRSQARSDRGIALITALLLIVFLFVVGVSFLYMMERDSYQQLQQERTAQAYYMAKSGIDFFYYMENTDVNYFTVGVPETAHGPAGRPQFFVVEKQSDGGCISRGWLEDGSGRVLAERRLVVPGGSPGGDRTKVYDANL